MQLKRTLALVLLGTILLLVAACVPPAAPTPSTGEATATNPVPETGSEETPTTADGVEGDRLANSQWRLVSLGAGETPPVGETDLTLEFDAEGRASGQGGCNTFGAGYTVDGDSITFEPVASTLINCEDEQVMQQEAAYYAALESATRFVVDDDRLTIETGQGPLVFERS